MFVFYYTFTSNKILSAAILFEASKEFLNSTNADEDDVDDDQSSFVSAPLLPAFPSVAMETLPLRYDHASREEQAAAVAMGGRVTAGRFDSALEDYYTLRLRGTRNHTGKSSSGIFNMLISLFQLCQTGCWLTPSSSLIPPVLPSILTPTPGPLSCPTEPSPHMLLPPRRVSTHSLSLANIREVIGRRLAK